MSCAKNGVTVNGPINLFFWGGALRRDSEKFLFEMFRNGFERIRTVGLKRFEKFERFKFVGLLMKHIAYVNCDSSYQFNICHNKDDHVTHLTDMNRQNRGESFHS